MDYECLSKEVDVYDNKEGKRACIKTIREFMKPFNMNQFDTSCALTMQFSELLSLCFAFMRDKEQIKEFAFFISSLSKQFELLVKNFFQFQESVHNKMTIKFGVYKSEPK